MATLLVAGVAVLDFVFALDEMPRRAEKYRAREAAVVGGGNAANAAAAIARLGGRARLATRLGDDPVGDLIVTGLEREGVDCTLARRFPGGRSSFSAVFVDPAGERQIVNYRDLGIGFSADWLGVDALGGFDAALTDTRWPDGAAAVLSAARSRGVPAVLDAEAPIREAAGALPLATHIAFSAQGLADFAPGTDRLDALKRARDIAGAFVCVTEGASGVTRLDGDRPVHTPAFPIEVRDTLGAGDVWHGAFALRLAEGAREAEAIGFANAVAAIKCTRFGGRAGVPTRAEAEAFLKERSSCV